MTMLVAVFMAFAAMACGDMSDLEVADEVGAPAEFVEVEELGQDLQVCSSTTTTDVTTVSGTEWYWVWYCDPMCQYVFRSRVNSTLMLPAELRNGVLPTRVNKTFGSRHMGIRVWLSEGEFVVRASYLMNGIWKNSSFHPDGINLLGSWTTSSGLFISRELMRIPDGATSVNWSFEATRPGGQYLSRLQEKSCNR